MVAGSNRSVREAAVALVVLGNMAEGSPVMQLPQEEEAHTILAICLSTDLEALPLLTGVPGLLVLYLEVHPEPKQLL